MARNTRRSLRLPNHRLLLGVFLLVVIAFETHALAEDRKITLAAYNVEWMTDVFDDPYTQDEIKQPKPRKDIEHIAAALRKINADVVGIEEVENEGVLKAMTYELLSDLNYKDIAVDTTNSNRGQNTGLVSRLPIRSVTSYRFEDLKNPDGSDAHERFARDMAVYRLGVSDTRNLTVVVLHLKSKYGNDTKSDAWRLAETTAVRRHIDKMLQDDPEAWIAVLGDFNDTPASKPVRKLLDEEDGKTALVDVHADLPAEAFSYRIKPYQEKIDYILVSPALAKHVVAGSAKILEDDKDAEGSDHLPVYVTFELPE
ncbi:MAG: hypothetical protein GC164_04095 [Phycisphaera sp.]|nr:hypothetical protein [Phycisphaera sp.]